MKLSIVTPMYHSARFIEAFYQRASAAAAQISDDYELVLVNDSSPDNALELAVALYEQDARVRVIDLARNFGQHKAMMTGLEHARGDLIFLIDCDLEIAPELLGQFYVELRHSSADVVYGVQAQRSDRLIDRLGAQAFYTLFNALSDTKLPANLTTVRLMSRRYVRALVAHQERELLIGGLWTITGFKQVAVPVTKAVKGSTTYHLGRKFGIIVNAVTSFSNRPLISIFYLGMLIILLSGIAAIFLVFQTISSGFMPGWPSLIVSVWLLGGLTIFCIGILGIYLSKVFIEVKQRPYTIIRQLYEQQAEPTHDVRADHQTDRGVLQ